MSDFSDVKRILDKIAEASSTNEKQRIIAENADNELFVKVVDYALDPYKTFKMTKLWPVTCGSNDLSPRKYNPDYVFTKLDDFCARIGLSILDKTEFSKWVYSQFDDDLDDVVSRILKKDLRCGASVKLFKKASDKFSFLPEHFPMKGIDDYEKFLKHAKGSKICVSPKLDGSRCYCVAYPDHVVFLSSNGKEIPNFQCLAEEFLELRLLMLRDYCQQFGIDEKDTIIFDGEVINIQGDFSKHMSQFRRLHEMDDSGFRFCIFDLVVDNVPFKDRYSFLAYHIDQSLGETGYRLKDWPNDSKYHYALVNHFILAEDAREICKRMVEEGFEGIMLKTLDHVYERKRSNSWCKMKPTYTEDFPVVDKVEGTGKYKGVLGALVIDRNGTKVEVGSGFTDEERKEFWENQPKAIEVKYQESLESGSLRFPIFVRVRDDWQPDNN